MMIGHRPGVALAGVVAAVGLTVAACEGPGPDTAPSPTASAPATPSAAELDAVVARALSASAEERRGAIEGDGTDYELIDRHPKAPVLTPTVVAVRPESASRVWGRVQSTVDGGPLPSWGRFRSCSKGTCGRFSGTICARWSPHWEVPPPRDS